MTLLREPRHDPRLAREPELEAVHTLRRLARRIVEGAQDGVIPPSGPDGWPLRLVKLAEMIRKEPSPIRQWAEHALAREAEPLFRDPDAGQPIAPSRAYRDPLRQMIRKGLAACPECKRPLPSDAEWEHWAMLDSLQARRRDVRKGAVDGRL